MSPLSDIGLLRALLAATMFSLLAGCATSPERDPAYAPVYPPVAQTPQPQNGAIYQAGSSMSLFEDQKAYRVGDLLTIELVEKTQASKSADTTLAKSNSVNLGNPTILGQPVSIDPATGYPLAAGQWNLGMGLDSSSDFSGEGKANQSNSLSGNITVTVVEVLPNGNMLVRGEKQLTLNQGDEFIRVAGIVRPADIRPDNSVLSTRLGDARISYSGTGAVADSNAIGWLARFFYAVWPF